ncbi:autotransporter translocation and assembly factor TamB [Thiogranum longum]|uniref:Autotransporter translocation and assembly factor TamB n=1 Tax=Thiogranum longum TaxID=1537524 RepID=A0A4R1HED3_9GAMM|nr:translocation/assembly module TamB domain-containing protein [Thiogranum longum]TCK19091.1 autotransporter translocation and assembly factor TamB [Thiogranum longum]
MLQRIAKYLFLVFFGLLVLITAALAFITLSETGNRWLIREAQRYAPGELEISSISGELVSGLTLKGVSYRQDERVIEIDRLVLDVYLPDLLRGTARIRLLDARNMYYRAPPAAPDAEPFVLPERIPLPLALQVDKVRVTGLLVEADKAKTVVDKLVLSVSAGPVRGLHIKQFDVSLQDKMLQLSGKADLHKPYSFGATLNWATRLPDAVTVSGEAELKGDLHRFSVKHTLSGPFQLTSDGTVQLEGEQPEFRFSGQWQSLRWPLSGDVEYASAQGDYEIEGHVDDYRLKLEGPLDIRNAPAMQVQARGHGDSGQLAIDALDITMLDGSLAASGNVAWAPGFTLAMDIKASGINPGLQWPEWPGRLDLETRLDVTSKDERVAAAFRKLRLKGTLHTQPITVEGDLGFKNGLPESTGLRIALGENRAEVSGVLDARTGLRYQVDAPKLAGVMPGLAGQVRANGVIKGPMDAVSANLDLSASGLSYQGNSVQTLSAQALIDPVRPQASKLSIRAQGALIGKTPVQSLALTSQGWIDRHKVSLDVTAGQGRTLVELRGGYRQAAWDGVLEVATLELRALGNWQLRDPVELHVTARDARPFKACWQAQQRQVCVRGSRENDALQLALDGESAEGQLHGDIRLGRPGGGKDQLSGTVNLDFPDLRFMEPLMTDIKVAGGAAAAEIRLSGSLDAPEIGGTASLSKGQMIIPALGIEMKNIGFQAEGKGSDVVLSGSADSGKGSIRLDGTLSLARARNWPFNVKLQGEHFAIISLPDKIIEVDPELQVAGSMQRVDVTGSVRVPYARIKLRKLPPNTVKVSADQVIVGPAGAPVQQPSTLPVSVNVVANIGDDVHFEGLGLSTNLAGSLAIRSLESKILIGNGVLELRNGRYDGYGQKLAIQRGRLLFAGPLGNPALDIQAARIIGEVTAGLQLTGNVESPRLSLFSNPAMANAEIMSYLVTGKPLNDSSTGKDSQALAAAAASLGANNPVSREISQKLGIDLGVQSGATDTDTALTVGKQLSPRLHIDYVYGLFNESAAFQVIYKLTRHLSLIGNSGAQQSIDLKYSIERK